MLTVTLSSKGQIVLPQDIRRMLGLQEGDKLRGLAQRPDSVIDSTAR